MEPGGKKVHREITGGRDNHRVITWRERRP